MGAVNKAGETPLMLGKFENLLKNEYLSFQQGERRTRSLKWLNIFYEDLNCHRKYSGQVFMYIHVLCL